MSDGGTRSWWETTWPIDTQRTIRLFVALLVVIAAGWAIGYVLFDLLAPNPLTGMDDSVADWFVDHRTDAWDSAAHWGSFVAATTTKAAVTIVVVAATLYFWRRWHEAVMIGLSLIFEATAFIVTTSVVGRPRPDVERLVDSPVDSSFPSGHVAAATVYGAFAIVVFWHTSKWWPRALAVALTIAAAVVVGLSRMYEGMHFLTDIVAGVILGLASLAICLWVLGPPERIIGERTGDDHAGDRQDGDQQAGDHRVERDIDISNV